MFQTGKRGCVKGTHGCGLKSQTGILPEKRGDLICIFPVVLVWFIGMCRVSSIYWDRSHEIGLFEDKCRKITAFPGEAFHIKAINSK
jgi:hypothetical protein